MQRYPPPELEAAVVFCGTESGFAPTTEPEKPTSSHFERDSTHTDTRDII